MVHRTKVSRWMVGTYAAMEIILTGALVLSAALGALDWSVVAVFTIVSILFIGAILPIRYEVRQGAVHVQAGLKEWDVPIRQIEKIYPTRDPMGAPALSLDRIRINYREGQKYKALLISPEDAPAFIDEVLAHDPNLVRSGLRVERAVEPV